MDKNILSPYIRVASRNSVITPPVKINDRSLYDYELILVEDGRCRITVEGTEYLCRKDDAVWIPPGAVHRFEDVDGSSFSQPHIHFDAVYSEKSLLRQVSYKPRNLMSPQEKALIQEDVFRDCNIPFVFTPFDLEKFRKVFYDIIAIYGSKRAGYELLYRARMLELIHLILSQFDSSQEDAETAGDYSILSIKSYIDNNFMQHMTLDMLEKQFYINKFTLLRNFRKLYRKNIMAYYRELRLDYAKNVLESTRLSVRTIGEKLNFDDAYSFSRFFKKYTGVSPKTYREEAGRNQETQARE